MPMQLERAEFEQLVAQAVDSLPAYFLEKMHNIEILLKDEPSAADYRRLGMRRGVILGLYHGIPLTKRTHGYQLVAPDTITIFQRPIERRCHNMAQLVALVRRVVMHEIAHHFGLSDARLRELGAY